MLPDAMRALFDRALTSGTRRRRLIKDGTRRYLEFTYRDAEILRSLGIVAGDLGPLLVACMWDEEEGLAVGGYLVVDNLDMGQPSLGGVRMSPDVTPSEIQNLARGMTLKNAAADLPFGGGKAGIVAPGRSLSAEEHTGTVRRFARLIYRYREIYNPGPDVGTDDRDMRTIAVENGLQNVVSKPAEMGGDEIDKHGGAAWGVVVALRALLANWDHLAKAHPLFHGTRAPRGNELTLLIQGFGAVGAHVANFLTDTRTPARIVGVSDVGGFLFHEDGLPIPRLFQRWYDHKFGGGEGELISTRAFLEEECSKGLATGTVTAFSFKADDLLREDAFCFVPAAKQFHYLDVDASSNPSITVERMGRWRLIVEAANVFSADPKWRTARRRMERAVYLEKGVLIAADYLVNSGGVILASFEKIIPTPEELALPDELRGNEEGVNAWLEKHAEAFSALAARRRTEALKHMEDVIARNMNALIAQLTEDPNLLPSEAAENIVLRRIRAVKEDLVAGEVMQEIPTIGADATLIEAAQRLVEHPSDILAVVADDGKLRGVVNNWGVTYSVAKAHPGDAAVSDIMTRDVVSVQHDETLIECLRKLESFNISAMPVLKGDRVQGMVCGDNLAKRVLLPRLKTLQ